MAAKSHEVAEQLKDAVVDQANQVRDSAQSAKEHTADRIRGVATQLRGMGDTLREDDPFVAKFATRASESIESVAKYVSSASTQSFIRDTEQLARRQPLMFFGGAFLAGLAAGRFLKSSRPEPTEYAGAGPRAPGSRDFSPGPVPRPRPSSFLPPGNEGPRPSTGSPTTNFDAAFGRDLPDDAHANAGATPRSTGGSPIGSAPVGNNPQGLTPLPGVSHPTPSSPPPRTRDKNGGGAGKGTLP